LFGSRISFNPRPLTSGRPSPTGRSAGTDEFQSTPAHERATFPQPLSPNIQLFQSTPAHERATWFLVRLSPSLPCFNPRPLTSGRPTKSRNACRNWSFNPRPLTSGRPGARFERQRPPRVSIHARSRAGDRATHRGTTTRDQFQSTPAHERATVRNICVPTRLVVSIHARSRAGDTADSLNKMRRLVSIHARSRAGDLFMSADRTTDIKFQSTPAHERATLPRRSIRRPPGSFNPRPLTSGRPSASHPSGSDKSFQSTPAHERATFTSPPYASQRKVSIHARSRAGDACRNRHYIASTFQSTPAHERATQPPVF